MFMVLITFVVCGVSAVASAFGTFCWNSHSGFRAAICGDLFDHRASSYQWAQVMVKIFGFFIVLLVGNVIFAAAAWMIIVLLEWATA